MGAVLGDSQRTYRLEHSSLTYTLAISGGIEDDVELAIMQVVGPVTTTPVFVQDDAAVGSLGPAWRSQYLYLHNIGVLRPQPSEITALGGSCRQCATDQLRE